MVKGTIQELRGTYGFIKPAGGGRQVFFHKSSLQSIRFNDLREGMDVTYDAVMETRGPKATVVRGVVSGPEEEYRFLNPYNFVRYLDQPRPLDYVLGDCPPPPHDRYVGLTGRITCEVENVTPLFVSDSHAISKETTKEGKEHSTYRFFEYDNEPALPASSLRGMVRSVFEAVTNSCFGVFNGKPRLEFRARPEYGNKVKSGAGIVTSLPTSDGKGEIVLCHTAKVGAYYEDEGARKNTLGSKPGDPAWQCGDRVFARAKKLRQGYVVRELASSKTALGPLGSSEDLIEGWLKITGRGEGTSKKSESLFLDPEKHGCPGIVAFDLDEMEEYNRVLQSQLDQDDLPVSPQSKKLSRGDLVWVETYKTKGKVLTARRIVRVQVPRIPYKYTIGELTKSFSHLAKCTRFDQLCPACRTFGWVHPDPPGDKPELITAYAGRVRLSHARRLSDKGMLDDTPLAILSTPKPTTTQFYLLNKKGEPDAYVDYNSQGAQLRGRKVYRHHGEANPKEYKYQGKELSDQHRTVRGALKPGAKFEFAVDFENLMPIELESLLYALELEEGLFHRLGYAKPLGFGSIKVTVKSLTTMDWKTRLASAELGAGWSSSETRSEIEQHKVNFLAQMQTLYGAEAFDTILSDLRALLGPPPADLLIHYPRPTENLDVDNHPQFEWFMGNKKRVEKYPKGKIRHEPVVLPKADEDREGLPLIDAEGKPVS